jgi:hypothetical protein
VGRAIEVRKADGTGRRLRSEWRKATRRPRYSRVVGGSIDVQTRSGLNQPHGDAFVFIQNGALNGTPPLEFVPYKPAENRVRAGLAIGGALQRDKTFYYVSAEQEIAHSQDTNDLRPATLTQINSATQQPGPPAWPDTPKRLVSDERPGDRAVGPVGS